MSSEYLSRLAYKQARMAYTKPMKNVEQQATLVTGLSEADAGTANGTILQAAIDNAAAGDLIQLPEGTFKTTMLTVSKNLTIQGVPGKTILENPTVGNYVMTLLYITGTPRYVASTLLSASAFPGSSTLYVASTASLSAGQWIFIRDSRLMQAWNGQDTVNQDIVQIESIVSATEIRLRAPLTRTFLIARGAMVDTFTTSPPRVNVSGISFERGRLDLNFAADCIISNCHCEQSEMAAFSFRNCTNCKLIDCSTEYPSSRVSGEKGQTFYLYNSSHCTILRHVSRWGEGAVLRRGTRFCDVIDCRFEGATTGLATYSGDCHNNLVQDCVFIDSILTWGAGGHYSDHHNISRNCQFYNNTGNVIGNGGLAIAENSLSYDGRALKSTKSVSGTVYDMGFENGMSFTAYGTTIPTGMTKNRRYFAIAPTHGNGTWGGEFLPSANYPKPPATVTFNNTSKTVDMLDGWATNDAIVLDGSVPTGLTANRIYFLFLDSLTDFYLQIRPSQTATFDHTTDTVTLVNAAGSEWSNGDAIMFYTMDTLPPELSPAPVVYYLRDKTGADTFKLAATPGGAAIELTGNGVDTHYALCGFTTAGSGTITAIGGTPLSISGTVSAATITTIGEGNIFEGHVIYDPPANIVYMHRCAGTVYRNFNVFGHSSATNGSCLFTFNACTGVKMINCSDKNSSTAALNRIASFSTCFDMEIIGGNYDKATSANLISGGTSENISVTGAVLPQLTSTPALFGSSILPNSRVAFVPERFETTTYAASIAINLNLSYTHLLALTGDLTLTGAGYIAGSIVTMVITADGTPRNLTFSSDWKFITAKPATIAASKVAILTLRSTTTAATGVIATWEVQS